MKLAIKTAGLLLGVFALYAFTRSRWLDEWDSVQFALGLADFNLWKHQPHPPGYPLYIFAGRALQALGLDPVNALVLLGCTAGAVFVTAWFLLVRRHFGEPLAWVVAAATAVTPAIWMTATKAVTDLPAAAALSVALWLLDRFRVEARRPDLLAGALAAAVAVGFRPQWFGVVLIALVSALLLARAGRRAWAYGVAAFLLGNLLWLAPTCLAQADAPPARAGLTAYPRQMFRQWTWRLDKPDAYIGASGTDAKQVAQRVRRHATSWLAFGLGLRAPAVRAVFALLYAAALIASLRRGGPAGFWRFHAPWVAGLALMVFCFLPEDRRYYTALTPLFWLAPLAGLTRLRAPWPAIGWIVPLGLLTLSLPIVRASLTQPPPPLQAFDQVRALHPPEERSRVLLLLNNSRRHAEWYARDFHHRRALGGEISARMLRSMRAVYTERADLPMEAALAGWTLEPVATFHRDPAVYPKHETVRLFRLRARP